MFKLPNGWNAASKAASVMSHGTPPRKTRGEKVGFLCLRAGSWPLHVQMTSGPEGRGVREGK